MTKTKKAETVAELTEWLGGAESIFSIDFTGLDVADTMRLRRQFKEKGVTYRVAKNTLVRRALENVGGYDQEVFDRLVGQTGIAIGYDDPAAPARVLKDFIDPKVEKPTLNFAVLEGQIYDGSRLKELAAMPSREEVIAGIIGSIHAPVSDLVGVINAVMRDLSSVIEEVAKKQAGAAE
jgi:large subunit ribosomal protein L10